MFNLWIFAAVGAAVVYWGSTARETPASLLVAIVKATAVAALVPFAVTQAVPLMIVTGLALGAAGDFALARPGKAWFLAGMAAFAAGHLAYIVQILQLPAIGGFGPIVPLLILLALLGWGLFWLAPRAGELRWPVAAYALIICGLLLCAFRMEQVSLALILGVSFFCASDFLLALKLFVVRDPTLGKALAITLWPLYWLGQALILAAFVTDFA